MLYYTGLLFLVIAVSLDGFGVGIAYGMRRIRLPVQALFIIMICSGLVVLTSMEVGNILRTVISIFATKVIGGLILIAIGFYCLWNVTREDRTGTEDEPAKTANQFNQFKTVIKEPKRADLDQSGIISMAEAVLLGLALSLDAFGAGIGAALLGYSPIVTPMLVAFMSGIFVFFGMRIGIYLSANKWIKKLKFLPPFLLIALGIINIFS